MEPVVRGKIRNPECIARLRDFSGLTYGNKTPTDIDAFMDFNGKTFVIIEGKHRGTVVKGGQKRALTTLCRACTNGGVHTIVLIAEHGDEKVIDYASLPVVAIYFKGKVLKPNGPIIVRQAVDIFKDWGEKQEGAAPSFLTLQ